METALASFGRFENNMRNIVIGIIVSLSAVLLIVATVKLVKDHQKHDITDEKKQENYIKMAILVMVCGVVIYLINKWLFKSDGRAAALGATSLASFLEKV